MARAARQPPASRRPLRVLAGSSAGFYAIAFTAVALSVAALALSVQTDGPGWAAAAGVIAAVGCLLARLILKRGP